MAEDKESTSIPLSQAADPEDPAKSPPASPGSSTRKIPTASPLKLIWHSGERIGQSAMTGAYISVIRVELMFYIKLSDKFVVAVTQACCAVLHSWVSKIFLTGCVVLFPVAVTFYITWWFIQFVDGFFSPLYNKLGFDIFGLGFLTSLVFVFLIGIFVSSWLGATVFWVGEWFIKRMPFVRHIYSASKQISTAISPEQNTTAFKEVAIIRHPRIGEYAFGFITSSVVFQSDKGEEDLCSVYVPTNHLYIGDIFLVKSEEIIRPNLSVREGIEMIVSGADAYVVILLLYTGGNRFKDRSFIVPTKLKLGMKLYKMMP
ncbi:hypothetical protein OPV22_007676 [Ensete ventricosum]|uniref:Protein LIKE COV 2 n=1 Tax=Ensete ventricosum TaxID=4639 RepID=A0AAV8RV08_ENSVE|nr:hypothetical protein OPV22_007676 [Ensete ventricosum]